MSLVIKNKLTIKLGEYATGTATALADPLLVTRAQDYRRFIAARMIPLDAADVLKRFPKGDYRVSLKVDGEFSILVYANGEAILVNPGGTVRSGLPLLKEAAALLGKAKLKNAVLAGELHYNRPDGSRGRVHDVSRVARQPADQAELDRLGFASFDIIEIDGQKVTDSYVTELKRIGELFKDAKLCAPVETVTATDAAGIQAQFNAWIKAGAEGAVVRSDAIGSFKIKPRHTLDVVVIGFTEGADDRAGMIHDLLMAIMRPDGCLQVIGHVGGGFSNDDRRAWLSDLTDEIVPSDYTEVNDAVAYRMVKPKHVIEISVLDMIAQSTRGEPVKTMVLHWTGAKFEIVRRLPLVNLISPQFVRRREDKGVNATDLRLAQVTDRVEVTLADRDARKLDRPHSEIIKREVCTKVMKGATMLRKLMMWKTNKETDGDEFPAYVIHVTDFSPNRKTPLERDIRISSSREQMDAQWAGLAEEYFGKGWTPVGAANVKDESTVTDVAKPAPKKRANKKAAE